MVVVGVTESKAFWCSMVGGSSLHSSDLYEQKTFPSRHSHLMHLWTDSGILAFNTISVSISVPSSSGQGILVEVMRACEWVLWNKATNMKAIIVNCDMLIGVLCKRVCASFLSY